jgi:hypothetical protein
MPVLVTVLAIAIGGVAGAAEDLTAMTNTERTARKLGTLVTAGDLQAFAQRRAEEMARAGRLWHHDNMGAHLSNWERLGENVGRGPYLYEVHRSFMNSQSHRDNILFPRWTQIGVGVASDGGHLLYVAVIFREPAAAPPPAPAPAPAPAPKPPPAASRRTNPPRPKVAAAPVPAPQPPPAPAPAAAPEPAPPPPPPPEPVPVPEPPPPEAPPPPVEVQGEAVPRTTPLHQQRRFLDAQKWDSALPVPVAVPGPPTPAVAGAVFGLFGVCGGVHLGLRRRMARIPWVAGLCGAEPDADDYMELPIG